MMFKSRSYRCPFLRIRKSRAFDNPVITLSSTRGKVNFLWFGAYAFCNYDFCICKSSFRFTGKRIGLSSISIFLEKPRCHYLKHNLIQLCRCRIIGVDMRFHQLTPHLNSVQPSFLKSSILASSSSSVTSRYSARQGKQ